MNTKTIPTIFAIVAAIGMLGVAAVAHADTGGIANQNSGGPQRGGTSNPNENTIHPAVNNNPNTGAYYNSNPTGSCAPISAGGAGHSNLGEPCSG
jgi:hypothetical protein